MASAGQVRRHRGQQVRLVEFECLAQLKLKPPAGKLRVSQAHASQAQLEDRRGLAVEVAARGGGEQNQAGLRGSGFQRSHESGFQIDGHGGESCVRESVHSLF